MKYIKNNNQQRHDNQHRSVEKGKYAMNWSENDEIGNIMIRKFRHHMRSHIINPCGLSLADKALELKNLCEIMSHYNTDYMGFSKINLDTLSGKVTKQIA
eukprot:9625755-Ditylum_brightwellii.AAC.1